MLEIAFETERLRRICEDPHEAEMQIGESAATQLRHRLADIQAASDIYELPAGKPDAIRDGDAEMLLIDLSDGRRAIFSPNHAENPTTNDGDIDWRRVRRLRLTEIAVKDV